MPEVDGRGDRQWTRDTWLASIGFVLGWLGSKTWQDPRCQIGLVVFLVATAALLLAFVLMVVGHGRRREEAEPDEDEEGKR